MDRLHIIFLLCLYHRQLLHEITIINYSSFKFPVTQMRIVLMLKVYFN